MSRTDKDTPREKARHPWNTKVPSWWNRGLRRREREKAAQDMRNGREPQPRYGGDLYW